MSDRALRSLMCCKHLSVLMKEGMSGLGSCGLQPLEFADA